MPTCLPCRVYRLMVPRSFHMPDLSSRCGFIFPTHSTFQGHFGYIQFEQMFFGLPAKSSSLDLGVKLFPCSRTYYQYRRSSGLDRKRDFSPCVTSCTVHFNTTWTYDSFRWTDKEFSHMAICCNVHTNSGSSRDRWVIVTFWIDRHSRFAPCNI